MNTSDYILRRRILAEQVGHGIIILPGNNLIPMNYPSNTLPFRQDSNFLYFAGIDFPGIALAIDCDEKTEILFADEPSTNDIIWSGHSFRLLDLANPYGLKNITGSMNIFKTVASASKAGRKIHYLPPYPYDRKIWLASLLKMPIEIIDQNFSTELIKAVVSQRLYKSEDEIEEIEKALEISGKIHKESMKIAKTGIYEYEVVSKIYSIAKQKNTGFAYPVICTIHGEVLHNETHTGQLREDRLLLIDAGVESPLHYASDITRTTPVNGKFTEKQKEIYQIVLSTQVDIINSVKPGMAFFDLHYKSALNITEGLKNLGLIKGNPIEAVEAGVHTLFYPHGLGHALGLDVHDMEDLGELFVGYGNQVSEVRRLGGVPLRFGRKLEPGFVVTVEPGIYFIPALMDIWKNEKKLESFINYAKLEKYRDFGGIRIEDNILITPSGSRLLGAPILKSIDEIESLSI